MTYPGSSVVIFSFQSEEWKKPCLRRTSSLAAGLAIEIVKTSVQNSSSYPAKSSPWIFSVLNEGSNYLVPLIASSLSFLPVSDPISGLSNLFC